MSVVSTTSVVTGTVITRLDAVPYSYLRIETDRGDQAWVAVPIGSDVANGGTVTVTHGAALRNFEVKKLGKTLDLVVFGRVK